MDTILLIDHDEVLRKTTDTYLWACGFKINSYKRAEEVSELKGISFCLFRKRNDNYEFARERLSPNKIPYGFLSAHSDEIDPFPQDLNASFSLTMPSPAIAILDAIRAAKQK